MYLNNKKKLLIIAPKFYDYIDLIKIEIEWLNFNVDIKYTFKHSLVTRILNSFGLNKAIKFIRKNYYDKIFHVLNNEYEIVVFITTILPIEYIDLIKKNNPNASYRLYLWDSISRIEISNEYLTKFDKIFSYSKQDSTDLDINYRPFFFNKIKLQNKQIDISFVGKLHDKKRYEILKKIKYHYPDLNLKLHIYLDFYSYVKNVFKLNINYLDITHKKLPYTSYIDLLSKSLCILDIPTVEQTEITTRVIEALGTQTKIITTVKNITEYDFYRPENIFLLNNTNFQEIRLWLKTPYSPIEEEILSRYSIENFINELIYK
ncbi:MAG: hypothetical protein ACERKD_22920 [Prolixibacteraceae bacterium]